MNVARPATAALHCRSRPHAQVSVVRTGVSRAQIMIKPRRTPIVTASVRLPAPSLLKIEAT